jgi:hypothetical protein
MNRVVAQVPDRVEVGHQGLFVEDARQKFAKEGLEVGGLSLQGPAVDR